MSSCHQSCHQNLLKVSYQVSTFCCIWTCLKIMNSFNLTHLHPFARLHYPNRLAGMWLKSDTSEFDNYTKQSKVSTWMKLKYIYRCLLWMKHFLFSRSLVRLLGKRKDKIIKLSSEKNRFKAATFSQFCLYLITFISDLIPHTDLWSRDFFARYYENFFANANPSFRKLPMKLPWRLRKILVHVNMSFGKLSTRIRKLSRYVFVHVNMSFGKLSTRIRKLSRYILVHVN